jgi:hypothetical protein
MCVVEFESRASGLVIDDQDRAAAVRRRANESRCRRNEPGSESHKGLVKKQPGATRERATEFDTASLAKAERSEPMMHRDPGQCQEIGDVKSVGGIPVRREMPRERVLYRCLSWQYRALEEATQPTTPAVEG